MFHPLHKVSFNTVDCRTSQLRVSLHSLLSVSVLDIQPDHIHRNVVLVEFRVHLKYLAYF